MAISDQTGLKLFDEVDGTEYDDDESLALFDNQRILVIGRNWTPRVPSSDLSPIAGDIPVSLPISLSHGRYFRQFWGTATFTSESLHTAKCNSLYP